MSDLVLCGCDESCFMMGLVVGCGDVVGMVSGVVLNTGAELCLRLGNHCGLEVSCGCVNGTILCLGYE